MGLILSWIILSLAFWLTAVALPGLHLKSFGSAFLVAAIFGILNALLGWLLFTVFAIATLGLAWLLAFITSWIINAIVLSLTASLTDRLKVDGFKWSLLGALMISVVGTLAEWLLLGALRS